MNTKELKRKVREVVEKANLLKDKYTQMSDVPVNYACIFSHSKEEYQALDACAQKMGKGIKNTPTGMLFMIEPLDTVAGTLRLLKIRKPDSSRPEQGDADFTIAHFAAFKKKYLSMPGFKIIQREEYEMIELMEPGCEVRAYFSNPPLDKQLGMA